MVSKFLQLNIVLWYCSAIFIYYVKLLCIMVTGHLVLPQDIRV
jgi:hypothetical protein